MEKQNGALNPVSLGVEGLSVSEDHSPLDVLAMGMMSEETSVCSVCKEEKPQNTKNFSLLKNGKYRQMCKPCQTKASLAWSAKRSDYRKQYHLAVMYQNAGIPAILPSAKEWKQGDRIMTVAYTDSEGVFHPSEDATALYEKLKAERKAERQRLKAEREKARTELAEAHKAERIRLKAEREKLKLETKIARAEERERLRAEREKVKSLKAEEAEREKARKETLRSLQRQADALMKAERAREEREKRVLQKTEALRAKSLSTAG